MTTGIETQGGVSPSTWLQKPPLGVILFFGNWVDHLWLGCCKIMSNYPNNYHQMVEWYFLFLCDNDCWKHHMGWPPAGVVFIPHEKLLSFESLFPGKQQVWCSSKLGVLQNEVVFPFIFFKFTSLDDKNWVHQFRNLPNETLTCGGLVMPWSIRWYWWFSIP